MNVRTLSILLFCLISQAVLSQVKKDTLHIYGPGGPFGPLNECAIQFGEMNNVVVKIIAGPEKNWIEQAEKDADIIYGGAEYMLTNFMETYPGIVDSSTRVSTYQRPFAVLVRPGNPKNLRSIRDLTKGGVKLLDVNGAGQVGVWEDIAGRQGLISTIQKNIGVSYKSTAQAIEGWKNDPSLDAWITYSSWYYRLKDITEIVLIPPSENLSRGTPIAITNRTKHSEYAAKFIDFIKSPKGHAVFRKWGWD